MPDRNFGLGHLRRAEQQPAVLEDFEIRREWLFGCAVMIPAAAWDKLVRKFSAEIGLSGRRAVAGKKEKKRV
jgi:hypothetical protein